MKKFIVKWTENTVEHWESTIQAKDLEEVIYNQGRVTIGGKNGYIPSRHVYLRCQ